MCIHASAGSVMLADTRFEDTHAASAGGAVHSQAPWRARNVSFLGATAVSAGGAVYHTHPRSDTGATPPPQLQLEDGVFAQCSVNSSTGQGGAWFVAGGHVTATSTLFQGSVAHTGGALAASGFASITLHTAHNTGSLPRGCLSLNAGHAHVVLFVFVFLHVFFFFHLCVSTLWGTPDTDTDSLHTSVVLVSFFLFCVSATGGQATLGGFVAVSGSAVLSCTECTSSQSTASVQGGAVAAFADSSVTWSGGSVSHSTAGQSGGAFFCSDSSTSVRLLLDACILLTETPLPSSCR